jgi:hypothetical protein
MYSSWPAARPCIVKMFLLDAVLSLVTCHRLALGVTRQGNKTRGEIRTHYCRGPVYVENDVVQNTGGSVSSRCQIQR